jgi:hypothetical protein
MTFSVQDKNHPKNKANFNLKAIITTSDSHPTSIKLNMWSFNSSPQRIIMDSVVLKHKHHLSHSLQPSLKQADYELLYQQLYGRNAPAL